MTNPVKLNWYTPVPSTESVTAIQWENGGVSLSRFEHWLETLGIKESQVYYQADVPKNRNPRQGMEACLFIINPDGRPGVQEGWDMARPKDWVIWNGERLRIVGESQFQTEWQPLDTRTASQAFTDAVSEYESKTDTELTPQGLRKAGEWFIKTAYALADALERREAGEELIPAPKAPTPPPPDYFCGLAAPHEPHSVQVGDGISDPLQCKGWTGLQYAEWQNARLNLGVNIRALPWRRCVHTIQHEEHAWLNNQRMPGDWMYCEGWGDTDPKAPSPEASTSTGSTDSSGSPSGSNVTGSDIEPPKEPCDLIAVHAKHTWRSVTQPTLDMSCPGMTGSEYLARMGARAGFNVNHVPLAKCDSSINHLGHSHIAPRRQLRYCVGRIPSVTDREPLTDLAAQ